MKKLLLLSVLAISTMAPAAHAQDAAAPQAPMAAGKGWEAKFKKEDANGDGLISREEYMKVAEKKFGKIDKNGDGNLSKEEVQQNQADKKAKWKDLKERRGAAAE